MTKPNTIRCQTAIVVVMAAALAATACATLGTGYTSDGRGSVDVVSAGQAVALANFADANDGVDFILFASKLPPGTHAVHIHTTCRAGGDPIAHGRLGNIDVDLTGIAKLQTTIKNAVFADLIGKALVVHAGKDYGVTSAEINSGAMIGCGIIGTNARNIARLQVDTLSAAATHR